MASAEVLLLARLVRWPRLRHGSTEPISLITWDADGKTDGRNQACSAPVVNDVLNRRLGAGPALARADRVHVVLHGRQIRRRGPALQQQEGGRGGGRLELREGTPRRARRAATAASGSHP